MYPCTQLMHIYNHINIYINGYIYYLYNTSFNHNEQQCGANQRDENRKYINKPCDIYPDLFIKFVGGKPPVITFEDNPEQPVDLTNYKNDQIHQLLKERGFDRVEPPKEEEEEEEEKEEEIKTEKSETEKRAEAIKKGDEPKINKKDVLEKLKKMRNPFGGRGGGIFELSYNVQFVDFVMLFVFDIQ